MLTHVHDVVLYFQDELEKSRHELEDLDQVVAELKAVSDMDVN